MIKEAIILAGGFGTRLQSVVSDVPKPMADINGKPFLHYILKDLHKKGFSSVILSVGYRAEKIKNYFNHSFENISLQYSEEKTPLGTGGAIKKALSFVKADDFFIINGDTFFDIPYDDIFQYHIENNSIFTIALKEIENNDRYGSVIFDASNKVIEFKEKHLINKGFINGGIYLANRDFLNEALNSFPDKFSFEKDFMEKEYKNHEFKVFLHEGYFIDIGIPTDYAKAITDFKQLADK